MKIKNTNIDKSQKRLRFTLMLGLFAGLGVYFVLQTLASPYKPYNPASERGIATYYDNGVVGGQAHCAAIHYGRGKRLRVTNKKAGSELYDTSLICDVSDAGPFGDGRVIDLNTEDFVILAGSKSVGTIPVLLELIDPAEIEQVKKSCNPLQVEKILTPSEIEECTTTRRQQALEALLQRRAAQRIQEDKGNLEKAQVLTRQLFYLYRSFIGK